MTSPCRITILVVGWTVISLLDVSEISVIATSNDIVKMRVIVDPVSLTQPSYAAALAREVEVEEDFGVNSNAQLVQPANFSGPEHFRSLFGQCFQFDDDKFEYKLCPFQNATQREIIGRRRATSIGAWHDWIVRNESFAGWRFLNGELCDAKTPRQTIVEFECGNTPLVWEVAEPERCRYRLTFKLPQACYTDPLLVYPILSEELQTRWDVLEKEYLDGEITDKGYDARLLEILSEAQLVRPQAVSSPSETDPTLQSALLQKADGSTFGEVSEAGTSPTSATASDDGRFQSVAQCQKAFDDIEEKLRRLKETFPAGGEVPR